MAHGTSRLRSMPTVHSRTALSETSHLAWEVQYFSQRPRRDDEEPLPLGAVDVSLDGESEWMRPMDLVPFESWRTKLIKYSTTLESSIEGCSTLTDAAPVQVNIPIMDASCPTFAVIMHLRRQGWKPVDRHVVHDRATPLCYDGCEATKFKFYLQCVASLGDCLGLSSALPSRQPVAYYRLLLRGERAEPYGVAKDYQLLLNQSLRRKGALIEMPALADVPAALALTDDPDGIICGHAAASSSSRPSHDVAIVRPAVVDGGASGSAGPCPGALPPPPLPPPAAGPPRVDPPPVAPPLVDEGDPDHDGILGAPLEAAPVVPAGPAAAKHKRVWVEGLNGAQVSFDNYVKPTGEFYCNFMIECRRCGHKCTKTKGRVRDKADDLPLAFLHAWLDVEPLAGKSHAQTNPPKADVQRFQEANAAALTALVATLCG